MKKSIGLFSGLLLSGAVWSLIAGASGGGGLPGFMTGGGSIISNGVRVTHGFHINCNAANHPQNLEINWEGNSFHLEQMTAANCSNDPSINQGQPSADFNTFNGAGIGRLDGVPGATISFMFTDAGEPGVNDLAAYTIYDADGNLILSASGYLDNGNQQAHK